MKLSDSLFSLLFIFISILPASSQQYSDIDSALLINTGEDYTESWINRVTDAGVNRSIRLQSGSSYTGHNINITNNNSSASSGLSNGSGISANNARFIHLTANEGTWNTITSNGLNGYAIFLYNMSETSLVSNTRVYENKNGDGIAASGSTLILDNVEVYLSTSVITSIGVGIEAGEGGVITNQGRGKVSITADHTGTTMAALRVQGNGSIDLEQAAIRVYKTSEYNGGVFYLGGAGQGTISLASSTITSTSGNTLVYSVATGGIVNLDRVNLDNAKNQAIVNRQSGTLFTVNLSNGTNFDGLTLVPTEEATSSGINMNIGTAASWNLTADSYMGNGTLALNNSAILGLSALGGTDFTDLYAAAIIIEQGTVINLDVSLFSGPGGTYTLLHAGLFDSGNTATVNLSGAESSRYLWDTSLLATNGTVTVSLLPIPEPSSSLLGVTALAIFLRRRK